MERFSALIGFVLILAIAYLLSNNRKAIRWRTVFWGLLLQIIIAIAVLKGKEIAALLSRIAIPIDRSIAALIFIVLAIIIYQVAKRFAGAMTRPRVSPLIAVQTTSPLESWAGTPSMTSVQTGSASSRSSSPVAALISRMTF